MTPEALANHLWQSTIFVAAAALLTLVLRKQHASIRYWIWQAASVKFLVPFSLLVAVGNQLTWPGRPAAGTKLYIAIEVLSGAAPKSFSALVYLFPTMAAVWLCGFIVVLALWCREWRKMSAAAREAAPLDQGREVETLRRVEFMLGVRNRTDILLTRASLEPGVFGIVRPVLLWPEGMSPRLDDAQLEGILAHEIQHNLRRDNLAAAIHMVVEATFWFHPLVWWLGARLVEERERACDEKVLEMGCQRQEYAEGILKVCEFCLASPLPCVSGVAGGDLKKRMVQIMIERNLRKMGVGRKLLLGAAAVGAIAVPIASGIASAPPRAAQEQTQGGAKEQPEPSQGVRVGPGEMAKLLVKKVNPSYPDAAKKAGIQGVVVLTAVISKDGDIEMLQIVSGHPALAPAAIEAVKQWKYRPYLVQGKPTEVKTRIEVNFSLAK